LRHSDIVDDEVAIPLGDDLADLVLDLLKNALRRLDARSGGRADVNLAAVDRREEVAPNKGSMTPPSTRISPATTGMIQRRFRSIVSIRT
jgi:hypothetical protein